ncbi:DUF167 domain-containing protein [Candidatus Woesearchaeota archaeon]|nr:DUF167 domain-containing protein [Candidatus Woesearchaeota archaeon]
MNLHKYIDQGLLLVRVIPNSSQHKLVEENGRLKLYLRMAPDKGKANKELIRFFKKEMGLSLEIKVGAKSRDKMLKIIP